MVVTTLGLVGAVALIAVLIVVLVVVLVVVRPRRGVRAAPTEIRPGDPVIGLPPRNPHVQTRSLSAAPRALTGPPGIGKSQTAFEYAHSRLRDFRFVGVVHATRTALIPDAYARFATALGIAHTADPVAAVHRALASRESWLIIFDDAGEPDALAAYLPPPGHYLVTSSAPGWDGEDLPALTRKEAVELLRDRCSGLDRKNATALAEMLEDFPLALDLAAGYLDVTGEDEHDYVTRVRTRMSRMRRGAAAAVWSLTAEYLRSRTPAVFEALEVWGVLGTEPIPLAVFGEGADADLMARLALAVHTGDEVNVHPLVQELIRSGPDTRRRAAVLRAAAMLRAYLTDAPDARWRALLPHVYAVTARPELAGDRAASWLLHHAGFLNDDEVVPATGEAHRPAAFT